MHIHILGICGTFMGGIAALAIEAGHRVTGCDANVYPPMSDQLRQLGIDLHEGWDPEQLDGVARGADVFVVGNVVSRGNPLMEAVLARGLRYTSGPQWIAENVLAGRPVLAVAGTHGKTTTTSIATWLLQAGGPSWQADDVGWLIGGVPGFGVSARLGAAGAPFAIEADEYDTAFFDKRSKFVHYRPTVALLNNLEYDHADIFPDLAAIETQFHHLVRTVPGNGRIVVTHDEPALERVLARGCWTPVERVATDVAGHGEGWTLRVLGERDQGTDIEVARDGQPIGQACIGLAGRHNRANLLAAIASVAALGVAPEAAFERAATFPGVRRRLEVRGQARGVTVIDDFAHHPTAIETTVAGLRARMRGRGRILAVLEPRSNTMKLGAMAPLLAASLEGAELTWCYARGLGWDVAGALAPLGARVQVTDDLQALVAGVAAQARTDDQVLVMSNGGFGGVHEKLLAALAAA